jgi:2-hydroxy-3-keto-5-methylthiopentenyl-1-phosphate phosphatase
MIPKIVFCDFDGTITEKDAFVGVCQKFAPDMVKNSLPAVMRQEISLREGITKILEAIPSADYPAMLDSVNNTKIRPGFDAFLSFLDRNKILFVVISGGLKGLVERQMGDYTKRVAAIYAADVSTDSDCLKVISKFQEGDELVAKARVMEEYNYGESVAIGDGITDFMMAKKADIIFATGHLANHMDMENSSYHPWSDFNDIRDQLMKLWDIK